MSAFASSFDVGHAPRMAGRVYSVGYEGMTVDALIAHLAGARVAVVVDVRLNPSSRKPGFSRRRLSEALAAAGIDYVHESDLGNPRDNRESFRSGDGAAGRERMRSIISTTGQAALDRVVALASRQRIAVLCFEREHQHCHRNVITEMAVEQNPEIEIHYITEQRPERAHSIEPGVGRNYDPGTDIPAGGDR